MKFICMMESIFSEFSAAFILFYLIELMTSAFEGFKSPFEDFGGHPVVHAAS
jgi:hypothetical protein